MTVLALTQLRTPVGVSAASMLLPLAPVLTLLALLAVFRVTAWAVVISNSVVGIALAISIWDMPGAGASCAGGGGAATGLWAVVTGAFDRFKQWLIARATAGIRVQGVLLTWASGALLEGPPFDRSAARGRVPAQPANRIRCVRAGSRLR